MPSAAAPRSSTSAMPSSRCTGSTARPRTSARRPRTCSTVSERTSHVVGLPETGGGSGEPAGPTSLGVYESLRATLERVTGSPDVSGRRITISGMGQVGSRLAVRLSAEGARLTVTDVNPAKRDLAAQLGADWIAPGEEHLVPADVFVPAGIGGLLTDEVIDALDARAVCGPANNPLADHSGADRLAAAASCTPPTSW